MKELKNNNNKKLGQGKDKPAWVARTIAKGTAGVCVWFVQ
jgi:hypothetical protein